MRIGEAAGTFGASRLRDVLTGGSAVAHLPRR